MFIATIIAQPGVFLDTWSQFAASSLDKTGLIIDNYKISKFLCHESNTQRTVSAIGIALLNWDKTYFLFGCIDCN